MDYNKLSSDISNTSRDEISEAVSFAYKTIDTLAIYARQKSDSVIEMLCKASPNELCDFGIKNGIFMTRLMNLNAKEKEITLNTLGVDAVMNGNSHMVTNTALSPSYAASVNYRTNFNDSVEINELNGVETGTRNALTGSSNLKRENFYYDDEDKGSNFSKVQTSNPNSIFNKTKKLFSNHKINTIISRFHTDTSLPKGNNDTYSAYGLSHGRNLLTAKSEKEENTYKFNGYDNPYCRVWTHHYQYDKLQKLIRPFDGDDESTVGNFHSWKNFKVEGEDKNDIYINKLTPEEVKELNLSTDSEVVVINPAYGWKHGGAARWISSVLGDKGYLNIAPKFNGGGAKNIHTKQCMFSIENLAWKDYDPYSFESALSYEQRGPMGGRIMWFPPYGISFNETSTTQWVNHSFIGRGEDVYTYANTTRTGTLNFMMVVDHPSLLDYVSWGGRNQDGNDKVSEEDVHRFFAGCDDMAGMNGSNKEGGPLSDYAVPTPLTDEYTEGQKTHDEKKKKEQEDEEEEQIPDEPDIEVKFFVFFPNNYSGAYDRVEGNISKISNETHVEAIPYLLYGNGAQMEVDGKVTKSLPISFSEKKGYEGTGYEMKVAIGEISLNYVIGTKQQWTGNSQSQYVPSADRKWFYRIDGEYNVETSNSNNKYINCYCQNIPKERRIDKNWIGLNSVYDTIKNKFSEIGDDDYFYSLAEIAYLLTDNEEIKTLIRKNCPNDNINEEDDRIIKLKELLNKENGYELQSIVVKGVSNSHGSNQNSTTNVERNKALAINRAKSVQDWLGACMPDWKGKITSETLESGSAVTSDDANNESGESAKIKRRAEVTMLFSSTKTEKLSEADQTPTVETVDVKAFANTVLLRMNSTYVCYSEITASDTASDRLKGFIEDCISDGSYTESMKEILRNLENVFENITVNHAEFIIENDELLRLEERLRGDEVTEIAIKSFADQTEFENKLGNEIIEQIKKLKDVKDYFKTYNKDYKSYLEENKDYLELVESKKGMTNKINDYTTELDGIKQQITDKENERTSLTVEIERLKGKKIPYDDILNNPSSTVDAKKDAQHEIDKIDKSIKECQQKIEEIDRLTNSSQNGSLDKKKKDLEDKIGTLNDNLAQVEENLSNVPDSPLEQKNFVDLNSSDIEKTIKDYIKKNSDINTYYLDRIAKDFAEYLAEKTEVKVLCDTSDSNSIQPTVSVVFDNSSYSRYNALVTEHTDEKDRTVNITKATLTSILSDTVFKYNGSDNEVKSIFMICDEEDADYCVGYSAISFSDDDIDKLLEVINGSTTKDTIKWDEFEETLNNALPNYMWVYKTEINEAALAEADAKMNKEISKIRDSLDASDYVGFSKHKDEKTGEVYYINENETDPQKRSRHWIEKDGQLVLKYTDGVRADKATTDAVLKGEVESNVYRYDQEYHFFRLLKEKDRMTYEKLMDKIQYFNPAYHSMTPEGFSARLTFLNQCMRQGDTVTMSDRPGAGQSANNLAFGRPPFCVLRLGDFYNQMIVIDNISINYDPLMWDLNPEGIGVIPLIANVSMSFKFIGGGDLAGPVRRLQNAMSFNYYANTALYDNRADRVKYNWKDDTCGALDGNELDRKNTFYHSVKKYEF